MRTLEDMGWTLDKLNNDFLPSDGHMGDVSATANFRFRGIPLMFPMLKGENRGYDLYIRYFDPKQNQWMDLGSATNAQGLVERIHLLSVLNPLCDELVGAGKRLVWKEVDNEPK